MHRRFVFPVAAAVAALLAFAPMLGGQTPLWAAESGSGKSTTTTMADDGAPADDSANQADPDSDSGTGSDDSSSTTATSRKGATSSTTAPDSGSGSGSSSANCAPPETDRSPAPQVGEPPQTHQAGEAGEVEVERLSDTELRIAKATPNDGWSHQVTAPSGPRVNVRFTRQGQSPSLIRFAASMDQAGQELHIRVTSCG